MTDYGPVLSALHPIIEPTFDALSKGLSEAQRYHNELEYVRADDPHFYLHAARRKTCSILKDMGLDASLVDESQALNMSGILIYFNGIALRMFHAQRDEKDHIGLPVPGHSRPRRSFWRQEPIMPGLETDNVVALWLDSEGALEDTMIIFRPLNGDHRRSSLVVDWRGDLSRGMAGLRAEDLVHLKPAWQTRRLA